MSAPAPAPAAPRLKMFLVAASPILFYCECSRRVRAGDRILWLRGCPQMVCLPCAKEIVQDVLEVHEMKELWKNSPGGDD